MKYDYLIVGAGLYGCTMARLLKDKGKSVFVIDKMDHIGGNCASEKIEGIECHKYGPHIFHTNDFEIIKFMARFDNFIDFMPQNKILHEGKLYNIPINLKTIEDVLNDGNKLTPEDAKLIINDECVPMDEYSGLYDYCVNTIGQKLYETCIEGYTNKQWGIDPCELPADIIKRLPVRYNYNADYFDDKYSMIPEHGWTHFFKNMLFEIPYLTGQDYFDNKTGFDKLAKKVIYTGPIDRYFNYKYGDLNWRSLKFDVITYNVNDIQGQAIIHYNDVNVNYTRSVEYKHIHGGPEGKTVVIAEIPCDGITKPFYPVNSKKDKELLKKYIKDTEQEENVLFGGRLAEYKYYNMDTIIEKALKDVEKCI